MTKKRNTYFRKPSYFNAREVEYGCYFPIKMVDGEISGIKKRDLYKWFSYLEKL